jgi:ATP-dependent DNA helicase RecG
VTADLERAGLPPAQYIDTGIGFTVILRSTRQQISPHPSLNRTELRIYDALVGGAKTVAELQNLLGLQPANMRKALRSLRSRGLVQQHGGQGQATWYERTNGSE